MPRLFINRNSGAVTTDAGARATLTEAVFVKRGDAPSFQLGFHRDGTPELPAAPLITFIVKQTGDYAGDAVLEQTSFTTPVDVSGFYVMLPDLTGDALLALLLTGPLVATVANATDRKALTGKAVGSIVKQTDTSPATYWIVLASDLTQDASWSRQGTFKEFVDFTAEIVLRESPAFGEESSQSFPFRVYSDYERGGETAPTGGTPFSAGIVLNRYDITTGLTGGGAGNLDGILTAANAQIVGTLIAIDVAGSPMWWRLRRSAAVTSSSVANPSVITTPTPHGFITGLTATIGGHVGSTPDINGDHVVTFLSSTTFSIPVNVTVGGTGGYVTRAEEPTAGIVRPDDFDPATNALTWQSVS